MSRPLMSVDVTIFATCNVERYDVLLQYNSVRDFHWKVAIKLSRAFCGMDDWQRTTRVCNTYPVSRIVKGTYIEISMISMKYLGL